MVASSLQLCRRGHLWHAQDVLDERNQIPRAEVGLPDDKIVYSCSNQLYKAGSQHPVRPSLRPKHPAATAC